MLSRTFKVWSPQGLVIPWNQGGAYIVCSAFDFHQQTAAARLQAEALKDTMQHIAHTKPVKTLSQPLPKRQPRQSASPWQPQPGSLTREEIRAIVIDQIG